MKNKLDTRTLVLIALVSVLGLFSKRLISPAANLVTDFIRIPGGSFATGFSLLFLVLGRTMANRRICATYMGFLQGVLAMVLGISGFQGMLSIVVYTVPGAVIDLVFALGKNGPDSLTCLLAGMLANCSGSLLTNGLFFHLSGLLFVLWMLISMTSGSVGGLFACHLSKKLTSIRSCQV